MGDFYFNALDVRGQPVTGFRSGPTREQVLAALEAEQHSVLELTAVVRERPRKSFELPELFGVPRQQVVYFTRQLAWLLQSGVLVADALQSLVEFSASRRLRRILEGVSDRVASGVSLSEALRQHPRVFDELYCSLVRIGETTGSLPRAAAQLADYLEAEMELGNRITRAATYPAVILAFSLLLMYGMLVLVFPGFIPMFEEGGVDLARYPLTRFLIAASRALDATGVALLAVALTVLTVTARHLMTLPAVSKALGRMAWGMPLVGGTIQLVVLARVARTLSSLVNSGLPLADGLPLAARAAGNPVAADALLKMRGQLESGRDVVASFLEAGLFPPLMIQMVRVGSQSGELGPALEKVADYFEKEAGTTLEALTSMLEPLMIIGVGSVVAVFIMGILLPILGMAQAMDKIG